MKILKTFQKITKFTAFFFSVYFTLFSSISYAQYSETAKPAQDYFQIAIPQELGTISNSYFTSVAKSDLGKDARPSAGMIIHIQDAHGQLSAQKNIQQILDYLVSKYGFKTVFLEGGLDGKISPDLLRFFKDEAANEKVANQLLEDGRIEGADVFLLKSKGKISAYGLESEKLYRKNILAFREVINQKKDADLFLVELKKQITSFGSHYFNPDLNKFSKEWLEFQDNRTETLRHLEILDLYANKYLKINLHEAKKQFDYPQLVRIFSIKKMEKDYGGESVRPQLQKDLKRLKKWLVEKKINPAYAQIFESLVSYSYSSLNPSIPVDIRSFLENFYAVSKPKGFSFSNYYVFMKYLGLLLLAQELEPERLFDEIKKMNVEILKSLANTPEENSLVRLIRDYYLVKKLFALELTRDEYAEIVEKEKIISPVILTSRLRMLDNAKIKATVNTPAELTDLFRSAIRFYDLAQQREDKMFNSMLSVLEGKQEKKIILVTGGFHSRGLETLMRGQNFSFIAVTPKMSEIQSNEKYIDQMLAGASTVPAVSPGKIPLNRIRSLMGEEEYQFQQRAIEKAKAGSLGVAPELAKTGIFSGLESELEELVAKSYIPENPTSDQQEEFTKAAIPIVERWIRDHQTDIRGKLFSAVSRPEEKEEQYRRNQAVSSPNLGIFTHVWRPGGQTRIHNHGGVLGITAPLTDGMEEDQFNFVQESDFGSSHGTVVEMTEPKKIVLEKGNASVITKGPGAIHRIRNTSSNDGIMLEIYFWLGNPPVQSVNTFVPVEGSASQYLVRHEPVDEITVSLVDKLLRGAGEAVSWMILERLKKARKNQETIKELLPMYTMKGTVITDLEFAIKFIGRSRFEMPKIFVQREKPYTFIIDLDSKSQHGASLGEKADPSQVRALLFQHINGLMVHPTIHVLASRGVFKLFGDSSKPKEVTLMEITTTFNGDDPYQNLGNIYGGMRTLALQGYIKIKNVDEKTSYELTEQGWAAVQQAESGYFREVVDAIGSLKRYHTLFRGPPSVQNESTLKQFQELVALSKVRPQINDVLMSPVMVALGMPKYEEQKDGSIKEIEPSIFKLFDKETQTLNLDSLKVQHNRKFLDAAFELLASQGLAEFADETKAVVRLTPMGVGLKDMVVSYGVTNSYLNLYEKLDEAFFGNPDPADIANDGHIDRVMDIWGSSGSHKPYLKNGKDEGILAMVKKIFDGPLDQQPEGVADMGCGDGRMLSEIVEYIILHTERGKNLGKYPLAVVAADYSPKSQGRAAATLEVFMLVPGVHVEVMFGDVTRPDNYNAEIKKRFAAKGIEISAKDLLHTQMFLPHERHLQVKTREEAYRIIREHLKTVNREALGKILKVESLPTSEDELLALVEKQFTVSYSDKGRLTPGIVAAADLIQFVGRWTQYAPKGLIILDLHTLPLRPEEPIKDKQTAPAYWGTHWISQHIMPYQEHNLCLLLAGLEPQETVFYPSKAPYAISLSNYLPSQIAKASSLGLLNLTRGMRHVYRFKSHFDEDEAASNKRKHLDIHSDYFMLVRELIYVDAMIEAYRYLFGYGKGWELDLFDEFLRDNMFYSTGKRGRMEFASVKRIHEILDWVENQISFRGQVKLPLGGAKILRDDVHKYRKVLLKEIERNPELETIERLRARLFSPQGEKRRAEGARLKDLMEEKKISALQLFKLLEPDIKPDDPEKERRRTRVEKWQKGLSSIPKEVWQLIASKPEPVLKPKEKLQVSKPIVPQLAEAMPVAASSLGSRNLSFAFEVAGAAAGGIVRGNALENSAFASMASSEEAAKAAQFKPSKAIQAFNQDISRFVKQSSGRAERITADTFEKQQDPFVLIAFADAFGEDKKNDDTDIAEKLAKSLHSGDLVIGIWKGDKPAFFPLLRQIAQSKITVHDIPIQLASDVIIQSFIGPRDISPISVSSTSEKLDLELKLNGGTKIKLNLDVLREKGIETTQIIALIRQVASNPVLRDQVFLNYGFKFFEGKEKGKGFWEVGEGFAAKLEEIFAKSLGEKEIARAA